MFWRIQYLEKKTEGDTNFIVDATPPLRMTSGCSVKTMISDRGYSSSAVELSDVASGSTGRGVRRNDLPVVAWLWKVSQGDDKNRLEDAPCLYSQTQLQGNASRFCEFSGSLLTRSLPLGRMRAAGEAKLKHYDPRMRGVDLVLG